MDLAERPGLQSGAHQHCEVSDSMYVYPKYLKYPRYLKYLVYISQRTSFFTCCLFSFFPAFSFLAVRRTCNSSFCFCRKSFRTNFTLFQCWLCFTFICLYPIYRLFFCVLGCILLIIKEIGFVYWLFCFGYSFWNR